MTKSSKKKQRKEIIRLAKFKQEKEIWEPDLPFDELVKFQEMCVKVIREAKRVSKPQSVANTTYGEARSRCHVGGGAHIDPENWPLVNGQPLSLVLELFLDDMPYVPPALSNWKLLQVFLELEDGDHGPAYNNGAWFVNTETRLEGLKTQNRGMTLDEFTMSWSEAHSTPDYPDDIDVVDRDLLDAFEEFPTGLDIVVEYFGSTPFGLRVGGWPCWISGSSVGDFILQMSGDFINVDLKFDGVIYIGLDKGLWSLVWEFG